MGPVEQPLLDDLARRGSGLAQRRDRLGDEERTAVLEPLLQGAPAPVDQATPRLFPFAAGEPHVQVPIVANLHGKSLQVVAGSEKAAAGFQVELPVVPVADEHAVAHAPLGHRIPHVRAAVVHRVVLVLIPEDSQVDTLHGERLALAFGELVRRTELVVHQVGQVDLGRGGRWQPVAVQRGFAVTIDCGTHAEPP